MIVLHALQARITRTLVLVGCAVLVLAQASLACTTFRLQDEDNLVFGRNYDWHLDHGLVIVNKSNTPKRALLLDPTDRPAQWVSKYGSVTFNQYGREMPCGGMNEAGLVLETMMLVGTRHPERDNRPAVMAWVQYQLDNHATIQEVIESDRTVRVTTSTPMPLHFLGCDRQGHVAVFEFLDGKLVCHTGDAVPVKALTNDTYDSSLTYLKQHSGFGGAKEIPHGSWESLDRFVCAADRVKEYRSGSDTSIVRYAFDTLASVSVGDATKWRIVYDLKNMEIHYQTLRYRQTRTIRLRDCDFNGRTPVQVISINTAHEGVLTPYLHHYETDLNRWLVYYSVKHTEPIASIPDALLEVLVQYPESPALQYLTNWEVAGPYVQEGKSCQELFDIAFDPERSGSETEWQTLPVDPLANRAGYLDLAKTLKGGSQRAAYLRTQIESSQKESARLEIYSDDGVKAWLNGELIHANNVKRGIGAQPDTVEVTLKRGTNHLMLKVTQNEGPWGAIVRVQPIVNVEPALQK